MEESCVPACVVVDYDQIAVKIDAAINSDTVVDDNKKATADNSDTPKSVSKIPTLKRSVSQKSDIISLNDLSSSQVFESRSSSHTDLMTKDITESENILASETPSEVEIKDETQVEEPDRRENAKTGGSNIISTDTKSPLTKTQIPVNRSVTKPSFAAKSKIAPKTTAIQQSKTSIKQKDPKNETVEKNPVGSTFKSGNVTKSARDSQIRKDDFNFQKRGSSLSSRSIAALKRSETPTSNLRKQVSTSGDQKKNDVRETNSSENQTIPAKLASDLKAKLESYMNEFFNSLKAQLNNVDETKESVEKKLEEQQDSTLKYLMELIDDLCSSYKVETSNNLHIEKLEKQIKDLKKSHKAAESRITELSKKHDEELNNQQTELRTKNAEETARKEAQIKDLQKKIKMAEKQNATFKTDLKNIETENQKENSVLHEKLKSINERVDLTQRKLNAAEQELSSKRKDCKSKDKMIEDLKNEIFVLCETMENSNVKYNTATNSNEQETISDLKEIIKQMENDKCSMELKDQQVGLQTSSNRELETKLHNAEFQIKKLKEQLAVYKTETKTDYAKDIEMELSKLRLSAAEKDHETEKLQQELLQKISTMTQLQEQIARDQQLLKVRSDLITSLQTNETNQRLHIQNLYGQLDEKTTIINELNNELQNKTEEFHNMFDAINSKHAELSNQDHVIRLLEEGNDRSQLLRIKQEEQIAKMQEDITHLKHAVEHYRVHMLTNDSNNNFYDFANERKRKRQFQSNIHVRKLEV